MAFKFAFRGTEGVARMLYLPVAASQDIKKGDALEVDTGLINLGAPADDAFIGIAAQNADELAANTNIEIIACDEETAFWVDYVGSTKTSLTNADLGTAFDLSAADPGAINLDDVTGGAWVCMGFDNGKAQALVKCLAAKRSGILG